MIGGGISLIGLLQRTKNINSIGIGVIAVAYFFSIISLGESFLNIIMISTLFIIFYGTLIYSNDMIMRDILYMKKEKMGLSHLDEYTKKWKKQISSNLALAILLASIASLISWGGSVNFEGYVDTHVTIISSIVLGILLVILLYIFLCVFSKE